MGFSALIISFDILLLLSSIDSLRANFLPLMTEHLKGLGCELVNCGRGSCKASNETLFGYDCECYPGWNKINFGPFIFPSCLIPNCTFDFECNGGLAPPLASPPWGPLSLPQLDFLDPCARTWCGDGSCVKNGTKYICKCNEGSANLLNKTSLACFKDCHFGADCEGLGYGSYPPQSPETSDSTRNSRSLKETFLLINFMLYLI